MDQNTGASTLDFILDALKRGDVWLVVLFLLAGGGVSAASIRKRLSPKDDPENKTKDDAKIDSGKIRAIVQDHLDEKTLPPEEKTSRALKEILESIKEDKEIDDRILGRLTKALYDFPETIKQVLVSTLESEIEKALKKVLPDLLKEALKDALQESKQSTRRNNMQAAKDKS